MYSWRFAKSWNSSRIHETLFLWRSRMFSIIVLCARYALVVGLRRLVATLRKTTFAGFVFCSSFRVVDRLH